MLDSSLLGVHPPEAVKGVQETCNSEAILSLKDYPSPESNWILSHFGLPHLSSGDSRLES